MNGTINRDNDRAAYRQIADQLREQIISGELPAGADLPSEDELAGEYEVGKNTVRSALGVLRGEGLIVSERGRRARVRPIRLVGSQRYEIGKRNYGADVESAFAREHGVPWSEFDVEREYRRVPAPARVATALRLDPRAEVYERQFTHATGGTMLRVSRSYLSADRFADTILTDPAEPLRPGGTIAMLAQLGIDVTHVRTEVTARVATPVEAELLRLAHGVPALEAWRIHFAGDDPVETAQHVYPAGGQILVFDIPVGPPTPPGDDAGLLGWSGPAPD